MIGGTLPTGASGRARRRPLSEFWDSSAIVPLVLEQPASVRVRALLDEDPDVVAWWETSVECASALARLRREGRLDPSDEAAALRILERLRQGWYEVLPASRCARWPCEFSASTRSARPTRSSSPEAGGREPPPAGSGHHTVASFYLPKLETQGENRGDVVSGR